jgi:RNA-directed DNA polymerase
MRPLGIANVVDRVVQQALKIVLEPIWEADFLPCSFGFRPKRSAHQALQAMREAIRAGRTWVVDADIDSFFDRLDHDLILECLRERVSDRRVLKLIRVFLSAGVLDGVVLSTPVEGAPQGGPLSPLLANVVLHRLDRQWRERFRRLGVLIRYADDEVICCPTEDRARAALVALQEILGELGLQVSTAKTRIVGLASGEEGCDFLGFHHRMMSSRRHPAHRYPACWPSKKAMGRACSRIRELTGRNRCHTPTHLVVADVNYFLRGWQGYFRFGNSSRWFAKLDRYVIERMALLISKRHGRRGRGHGMKHVIMSGNRLGLVKLSGTVQYGRIAHAVR